MIHINSLIDDWKVHFKYEEELMRQEKYHEYDKHKSEHEDIKDKFLNIKEMEMTGFADIMPTIVALLDFWLEDHMKTDDKRLGQFLKGKMH
tara:strand:+ start:621 stop:893 length:273 start_codon:yes stop_codon:yes gene_type:complete